MPEQRRNSEFPKSNKVPIWALFVAHVFKWGVVLILVGAAIFFACMATTLFPWTFGSAMPMTLLGARGLGAIVFAGFAVVSSWYGWRALVEPVAHNRMQRTASPWLVAEYRSVFNQEQLEMSNHMGKLFHSSYFAEALMLLERLLPIVTDHNSEVYLHLLLIKLSCLLHLDQSDEAEKICADYVQENISNERKLTMLDGFASYILYQSLAAHFGRAEKFARMGLEIAPGTWAMLTLKGTLGSLLVEQGNYAEGEPLLLECLQQSHALTDQAISSFYLGMIKMRSGNAKEGKRLIKWAMRMYPESWMVEKGKALLKEARR